jgi:GDPmannose 4,6-dehydratase
MTKRALITGITGQDGSYLAELLLSKGYEVFGLERRSSTKNRVNLGAIENRISLISGDLSDQNSITRVLSDIKPHEVYNIAAQSFVKESWDQPEYTANVTGLGALRVLEAIRHVDKKIKFYQASSSEMFGKVQATPQNETTPFYPRSPYGVAKLFAHWMTVNYRESYNIFAVSGILFNHESERRGIEFVTRKITDGLVRVKLGLTEKLEIGTLDSRRDWGYAPDYVEAMWLMLQQDEPEDFVIATGTTHSVREFIEATTVALGIELMWQGTGVDEVGLDTATGNTIVKINPQYYRPAEVDLLLGDARKAKEKLGWMPKVQFRELVARMVNADMKRLNGS